MYIYPSIFREFGGEWFKGGKLTVNGPEAEAALTWYVDLMRKSAPTAARNWNWPDIADAFSQGTLGKLHRRALLGFRGQQSREVEGDRQGRLCPLAQGPVRQARHLDLELGLPDQRGAARQDARRRPGCSSSGRPARRPRRAPRIASPGPAKRSGVNRTSIWQDPEYVKLMNGFGDNFVEATLAIAAGGHRRRLASARAAMAGDRRHHGDRHPVGAVGSGHRQGRARRRPAPRRTDDAGLTLAKPAAATAGTAAADAPPAISAACWRSASAGSRPRCWRRPSWRCWRPRPSRCSS